MKSLLEKNFKIINNMINEFYLVMTKEEMLEKYKWFSIASGIKDDKLTLVLMKRAFKENTWHHRIK